MSAAEPEENGSLGERNPAASNEGEGDDDDTPRLSAHALAALQEFYAEQAKKQVSSSPPSNDLPVSEDWQLSQFWYNDVTAQALADEALKSSHNKRIACVSCPTLYAKLLELKSSEHHVILLEYDSRFQKYGDGFVQYDYRKPLDLPAELQEGSFGLVVADPPFLSEECLSKTSQTIRHLTKDRILLCTGAVMRDKAKELLDVEVTSFIPAHRNNLANTFSCYANYNAFSGPS